MRLRLTQSGSVSGAGIRCTRCECSCYTEAVVPVVTGKLVESDVCSVLSVEAVQELLLTAVGLSKNRERKIRQLRSQLSEPSPGVACVVGPCNLSIGLFCGTTYTGVVEEQCEDKREKLSTNIMQKRNARGQVEPEGVSTAGVSITV